MIGSAARLLASGASASLTAGRADMNLLREVLARTRVVRTPAGPHLGSYFQALLTALFRWIFRAFHARPELTDQVALAVNVAALALLATALSILAIWLWRRLVVRRSAPAAARPLADWRTAPDRSPERWDRSRWRKRIDELLSAGNLTGALEAVWWWFATSLDPEGSIDSSWTTRELLRRAGRPELSRAATALDVLMYGRAVPLPSEVSACVGRLEKDLA